MALIEMGALASNIKGKMGGSVFQNSSSGLVMRRKGGYTNKNTEGQNFSRNITSQLQTIWQSLTVAQRTLWDVYAVYRNAPTRKSAGAKLGGQALFMRENTIRLTYNFTGAITIPSVSLTPVMMAQLPAPIIIAVFAGVGTLEIQSYTTPVVGTSFMVFYVSQEQSPSQLSGHIKRKLFCLVPVATDTQDIGTAYIKAFGRIPSTGNYLTIDAALYNIDIGTLGQFSTTRILIT